MEEKPTVAQNEGLAHDTPVRPLAPPLPGLRLNDQAVPFQVSISSFPPVPTQNAGLVQDTASVTMLALPGLLIFDQRIPFQVSVRLTLLWEE